MCVLVVVVVMLLTMSMTMTVMAIAIAIAVVAHVAVAIAKDASVHGVVDGLHALTGRVINVVGTEKDVGFLSHEGGGFDGGVETGALVALDTQKVPASMLFLVFAIVAQDGNDPCQIGRDGLEGNAHGHGRPCGRHLFVRFCRLFTDRTAGIKTREFPKAMPMNGMATGHFMTGTPTRKQILLTHGTIGHVLSRLAIMIIKQHGINAHSTIMTMPKVILSTHPTKSTLCTMIGLLLRWHPQITNITMIAPKLYMALDAIVSTLQIHD
jgi:hypothetical protein